MKTRVAVIRAMQPDEDGNQLEHFIPIKTPDGQLMYRRLCRLLRDAAIPDVSDTLLEDLLAGLDDLITKTPDWLIDLAQRIALSDSYMVLSAHYIKKDRFTSLIEGLKKNWPKIAKDRVSTARLLVELRIEIKKRLYLANNLLICRYIRMLEYRLKEHLFW